MSLHEYQVSQKISAQDPPFYALIMAAFREADSRNHWKLRRAFPHAWHEFNERHDAPGGRLGDELLEQVVEELPETILGREVIVEEVSSREIHLTLGGLDVAGWLRDKEGPIPCPDTTGCLEDEGVCLSEEEYPETMMGMPIKVTEGSGKTPTIVLGSFNDYDHREKET